MVNRKKLAGIESEKKLQTLKFVDFLVNLSDSDKALILDGTEKYFIAWRAVWSEKSLSTLCRIVLMHPMELGKDVA